MQARDAYTKRTRNRLTPSGRWASDTQFSESLFGAPVNAEDDLLDPAIRRWTPVGGNAPRLGCRLRCECGRGAESALRAANTAAALVEQIKHAPPKPLESIAAQSGLSIDARDFRGWYRVCDALRNGKDPNYLPPSEEEIEGAYQAYTRGMADFY